MTDPSLLLSRWCDYFKKGNDFDAWGQFVEASEEYNRLSQQIKKQLSPDNKLFTDQQKKSLNKIVASLDMRRKAFESFQQEHFTLQDLRQVYPVLENILSDKNETFPIKIELPEQNSLDFEHNLAVKDNFLKDQENSRVDGTLLPRIPHQAGHHRLTIRIVKIGLKYPFKYIDPFITVSVKDVHGLDVTSSQDTPVSKIVELNDIIFSNDVELQRVVEKLPKGSAVFFEFKHFKPERELASTKCWAFMELDELKAGPACIELYKKPTDYLRKKIRLLTVKPLYLHLLLTIHDDD